MGQILGFRVWDNVDSTYFFLCKGLESLDQLLSYVDLDHLEQHRDIPQYQLLEWVA